MNQNKYRTILSTPGFSCGNDVNSNCVTLTVSQDTDLIMMELETLKILMLIMMVF